MKTHTKTKQLKLLAIIHKWLVACLVGVETDHVYWKMPAKRQHTAHRKV